MPPVSRSGILMSLIVGVMLLTLVSVSAIASIPTPGKEHQEPPTPVDPSSVTQGADPARATSHPLPVGAPSTTPLPVGKDSDTPLLLGTTPAQTPLLPGSQATEKNNVLASQESANDADANQVVIASSVRLESLKPVDNEENTFSSEKAQEQLTESDAPEDTQESTSPPQNEPHTPVGETAAKINLTPLPVKEALLQSPSPIQRLALALPKLVTIIQNFW